MIDIKNKKLAEKLQNLKTQIDASYSNALALRSNNIKRYNESWDYYNTKLPAKVSRLESGYIEPVVKEAVDKVMPSLLDIFTESGTQAVAFRDSDNVVPSTVARAVNRVINTVFMNENDGYNIFQGCFREALITGDCFVKSFIEEEVEEEELTLEDWTPALVLQDLLAAYPDTDISTLDTKMMRQGVGISSELLDEAEVPEDQQYVEIPVVMGDLLLRRVTPKLKVEQVELDKLVIDTSRGADLSKARYICHKHTMTVGEAIEMGFEYEDVKDAELLDVEDVSLSTDDLVVGGSYGSSDKDAYSVDPMERKITIFEHYIYSSLLNTKAKDYKQKLYQVYATGQKVLQVEEVDAIPFIHGVPEESGSSFWGSSLFDKHKHQQDELSYWARVVAQNAAVNTLGRFMAVKGQYNRQDLLQSAKAGAITEVTQMGSVTPYPEVMLPAAVESIYQKILISKNESVATSVGQALNSGSLTNVASQTMSMAISNSNMKDKVIAKCLARTFVQKMFERIYDVLRQAAIDIQLDEAIDEQGTKIFNSSQLPEKSLWFIDVNTSNDDAMVAGQLVNIMMTEAQVSQTQSAVITPENRSQIYKTILKHSDIPDVQNYISNPAEQQPSPEEIQMQQKQLQLQIEAQEIGLEKSKAELQKLVAETAKVEVETSEAIRDGASGRQRAEEKSAQGFKKLEIDAFKVQSDYELTKATGGAVSIG